MVRLTPTRTLSAVVLVAALLIFARLSGLLVFGARGFDLLADDAGAPGAVQLGQECSPFAGGAMGDVAVVLKIASSEVAKALPAFLDRLGRCRLDLLIFSDRPQEYRGFPIVDALEHLRPEYRYQNADFDVYDRIHAANAANATDDDASAPPPDAARLDKYKLLPMMELAAAMRPQAPWFVVLELDTYVNWDNLYRFLAPFNPRAPHYFGSPVWPRKKTVFAHGGSGFVLSRGALDKLVARGRMFAENHEFPGTHLFGKPVAQACCGDEVLAQVLAECGVKLRGYWPMFNGEKPQTVRFGWEQWCEAVITMHHVGTHDLDKLKLWEATREHPQKPLTFAELFAMAEPLLRDRQDDWSNMSEDVSLASPHPAALSFDTCLAACLKDKSCMQYEHHGETCRLSHSIRLGHPQRPDADQKWVSGWLKDRIKEFQAAHSPCAGARFVHANP